MSTKSNVPNRQSKRRRVADRDGASCAACGGLHELTLDHIIPRSRGGSSKVTNLQFLCYGCNQAKDRLVVQRSALHWIAA